MVRFPFNFRVLSVILAVICCFLISSTFCYASSPFVDTFDSYDVGSLNGQGDWVSSYLNVVDSSECYYDKCIYQTTPYSAHAFKIGDGLSDGSVSVYYKTISYDAGYSFKGENSVVPKTIFSVQSYTGHDLVLSYPYLADVVKDDYPLNTWFKVTCEWKDLDSGTPADHQFRCRYNSDSWTEWRQAYYTDVSTLDSIDLMYGDYWDSITGDCSSFEYWQSCESGGCAWVYDPWNQEYLCTDKTEDLVCGEGETPLQCQGCLTEETCEGVDNCFWDSENSLCQFGSTVCGAGSLCSNCATEETCEAESCTWDNGFCYISPPESQGLFSQKIMDWYNKFSVFWNKAPFNYVSMFISAFNDISPTPTPFVDPSFSIQNVGIGSTFSISLPIAEFLDDSIVLVGSSYTYSSLLVFFSRIFLVFSFFFFIWRWINWVFGFKQQDNSSEE